MNNYECFDGLMCSSAHDNDCKHKCIRLNTKPGQSGGDKLKKANLHIKQLADIINTLSPGKVKADDFIVD